MTPILGYWDIRGIAAPIRYLLEYAGVSYEDKLYKRSPPPALSKAEWLNEKFTLGLDLPNLPYYIDDDVKLTQSDVILRHLGRKHGLVGRTEAEQLRVELAAAQVRDYLLAFGRIIYSPQFLELAPDYSKGMPDKLKLLSQFLGHRKFIAGDYVTYADFSLAEFLALKLYFDGEILTDFRTLQQYHDRVFALEAIDKYFRSSRAIRYPFIGAPAYFGGQYSEQLLNSK